MSHLALSSSIETSVVVDTVEAVDVVVGWKRLKVEVLMYFSSALDSCRRSWVAVGNSSMGILKKWIILKNILKCFFKTQFAPSNYRNTRDLHFSSQYDNF